MPLTVHHLQYSQSDRIPWLCEELGIRYELVLHQRDPVFSPQAIKDLNPIGAAPVIQDGSLTLAESAACVEYIIHKHGNGKLALPPTHKNYADYLYWLNFSNGTFQPILLMLLQLSRIDPEEKMDVTKISKERLGKMLKVIDERLKSNAWLAGEEFTAADVMIVTSLTTVRCFYGYSLEGYEGILGYLKRVGEREAWKVAKAKADPDMDAGMGAEPPRSFFAILREQGKL